MFNDEEVDDWVRSRAKMEMLAAPFMILIVIVACIARCNGTLDPNPEPNLNAGNAQDQATAAKPERIHTPRYAQKWQFGIDVDIVLRGGPADGKKLFQRIALPRGGVSYPIVETFMEDRLCYDGAAYRKAKWDHCCTATATVYYDWDQSPMKEPPEPPTD